MKTRTLFFAILATMSLASCGTTAGGTDSTSESDSSSNVNPTNSLASVLSSFKDNCTVTNVFQFISTESGTANVVTNYVEQGYYSTFNKAAFGTEHNTGYISKDNKTYAITIDNNQVTLGDELTKNGASVSSFRDVYYDPSYISSNVSTFTKENVFVPRIKGTTYGTFDLYGKYYGDNNSSSGTLVQDNTETLILLAKCLGVYQIASSYAEVEISAADLYFSANGTSTYNFKFYFTYKGGYDRLTVVSNVTKVGSTSIKAFDNYFEGN